MRKVVLWVAILLSITSIGYCKEQALQLNITSDKKVYEAGEKIWIVVDIRNISERNSLLMSPGFNISSDNLKISIYSPIRFSDNVFDDTPNDKERMLLRSKNNLTLKYNLYDLKWSRVLSSKWADTGLDKFIQPGKYQLFLKIADSPVMYNPKYIDYTSNIINIEVVEK